MDRGEDDVVPARENVLGAVAVVIIDVEDRDRACRPRQRRLGSDRGMVQIGIAAEIIAAGVMAGRPGEGEGARFAAEHGGEPGERRLHPSRRRPRCRSPIGVEVSKLCRPSRASIRVSSSGRRPTTGKV